MLLSGRLQSRLRHYGISSYGDYYQLVISQEHAGELQIMVDLLTTNETYFFREPAHFDFLVNTILPQRQAGKPMRVWSAASSTGEEAYSLAMVLANQYGDQGWQVFGSDISEKVLGKAQLGHYPVERNEGIPAPLLKKYCLKGVGRQAGTFLVAPNIRQAVSFAQVNLTHPVPEHVGVFDVIFLRNVMIYFDMPTKQRVLAHLLPHLDSGGYFIIGHSESLHGVSEDLHLVRPTVYRKP